MSDVLGVEYRDEDWEHGLRCTDCNRLLAEGERYSERLSEFIADTPLVEIICVGCAVVGAQP